MYSYSSLYPAIVEDYKIEAKIKKLSSNQDKAISKLELEFLKNKKKENIKQTLSNFYDIIVEKTGIDKIPLEIVENAQNETNFASYQEFEQKIYINLNNCLNSGKSLIEIISVLGHETRHRYQHQYEVFREYKPKYEQFKNFELRNSRSKNPFVSGLAKISSAIYDNLSTAIYANSICEKDARSFGTEVFEEIHSGVQYYLQLKKQSEIVKLAKIKKTSNNKTREIDEILAKIKKDSALEGFKDYENFSNLLKKQWKDFFDNNDMIKELTCGFILKASKLEQISQSTAQSLNAIIDFLSIFDLFLSDKEKQELVNSLSKLDDKNFYIQAKLKLQHESTHKLLKEFRGKGNIENYATIFKSGCYKSAVLEEVVKQNLDKREFLSKLDPLEICMSPERIFPAGKVGSGIEEYINSQKDFLFSIGHSGTKLFMDMFNSKTLSKDEAKGVTSTYIKKVVSSLNEKYNLNLTPQEMVEMTPGEYKQRTKSRALLYSDILDHYYYETQSFMDLYNMNYNKSKLSILKTKQQNQLF